jgi:hypothetical protein
MPESPIFDLFDSSSVALNPQEPHWDGQCQMLLPFLDGRPARLNGPINIHFSLADSGYIEKIVREPGDLPHLPLSDLPSLIDVMRGSMWQRYDIQGVLNGRKRGAQFMT